MNNTNLVFKTFSFLLCLVGLVVFSVNTNFAQNTMSNDKDISTKKVKLIKADQNFQGKSSNVKVAEKVLIGTGGCSGASLDQSSDCNKIELKEEYNTAQASSTNAKKYLGGGIIERTPINNQTTSTRILNGVEILNMPLLQNRNSGNQSAPVVTGTK